MGGHGEDGVGELRRATTRKGTGLIAVLGEGAFGGEIPAQSDYALAGKDAEEFPLMCSKFWSRIRSVFE